MTVLHVTSKRFAGKDEEDGCGAYTQRLQKWTNGRRFSCSW